MDAVSAVSSGISSDDRALWLATRRRYIGASDIPAVLGIDPFRSALDVYMEKLGMAPERAMTPGMEAGLELESAVLAWYGKRYGKTVERCGVFHASKSIPWAGCTPDGFEVDGAHRRPVQVKCTGRTDAWDSDIPPHVYAQVQYEMMVVGEQEAVALALVSTWGGFDLRPYTVGRDEPLISRMVEAGEDMARRIREQDPPDPDGSDAAKRCVLHMCGAENGGLVVLDIDAAEDTSRIKALDAQIKELTKSKEALRQKMQLRIGDATAGAIPGGGIWTFKNIERAGYTVEPTTFRQLAYKAPKKG